MEAVRDETATHPPVAEKVACVDFDGTIAPWGSMFSFPEPLPGVVEAVKRLKAAGYEVVIFTSRLSSVWHESEGWDHHEATEKQVEYLREYCKRYDIPADGATAEKIPAEVYLDDKAMGVTEKASLLDNVREFVGTPVEYGFPFEGSRSGKRWHRVVMPEIDEVVNYGAKNGYALCSQNSYYRTPLDPKRRLRQVARPEPYCKHCLRAEEKLNA